MVAKVDLDAYFQRIHWSGGRDPTLETLAGLIKAHTAHIPFENLDILLGRTLSLDLEGLQDKIVSARRGGYCFEHASLFAAVLESLDFQVARHAARVVLFGPLAEAKRDHMFMTVVVGGATYVVDPGFGPFAPAFRYRWWIRQRVRQRTGCSATATSGSFTSRGRIGSLWPVGHPRWKWRTL